jgi:hypothetical protein
MKLRKAAVLSILLVLGIACVGAVVAVYTDIAVQASAPEFAGLNRIPADCQFVFGVNVQKFMQSRASAIPGISTPIDKDLAAFTEQTGLDPSRDITYLVGGSNGKEKASGIVIASGVFNRDAIMSYARSKSAPAELSYAGVPILIFPDPRSDASQHGIAFVDSNEIALGDLDSLKSVLDIRAQESRSILSNPTMVSLIKDIGPDEMFWFAGDASGMLSKTPAAIALTAPLRSGASNIKNVVGSLNVGEALRGKIVATAFNPEQALKLADAVRGLIAIGQLAGSKNPELQGLFAGLVISQSADQIRLDLNIPADVLIKMSQRSKTQRTN